MERRIARIMAELRQQIQAAQLCADRAAQGTSFLKHEFYVERLEPLHG